MAAKRGGCVLSSRQEFIIRNISNILCKAIDILGADRVEDMEIRMTAEDFAWFAQTIPGMMYRLGVKEPGTDQVFPLHTPGFRVDESALKTGITMLTSLSIELLKSTAV